MSKRSITCAVLLSVATVASVAACKKKSDSESGQAAPSPKSARQASAAAKGDRDLEAQAAMFADDSSFPAPTVTLVEPGSEPRTKMRYTFKADRSESLALDMRTGTTREIDGKTVEDVTLPTIHVVLLLEPKSLSKEGTLTITAKVESATVLPDPKGDPELARGVKEQVDLLPGTRAHATIDARGITTEAALDSRVGLAGDDDMAEQIVQTLRDLAPPFPEEAIGTGAKWEKLTNLSPKGGSVMQRESYTLLERSGDRGRVKIGVEQTAPPQTAGGQGLPEGTKIESFVAEASGASSFELTRLVPNSNIDGRATVSIAANDGVESHKMKMVMRLGVAVAGGKR